MLPYKPFNSKHRIYNDDFISLAKKQPHIWGWLLDTSTMDIQNRPMNNEPLLNVSDVDFIPQNEPNTLDIQSRDDVINSLLSDNVFLALGS